MWSENPIYLHTPDSRLTNSAVVSCVEQDRTAPLTTFFLMEDAEIRHGKLKRLNTQSFTTIFISPRLMRIS